MKQLNVLIIDGQGGRIGRQLVERIRASGIPAHITAVGTNSAATAAMLKGGADQGATGENAVAVCSRSADVIVGPIGIVIADAMLGEITENMAVAVGKSGARKLLLQHRCRRPGCVHLRAAIQHGRASEGHGGGALRASGGRR